MKSRIRLSRLVVLIVAGAALVLLTASALAFSFSNDDPSEGEDDSIAATRSVPDTGAAVATEEAEEAGESESDDSSQPAESSDPSVLCGSGGGGLSAGPPESPESLAWVSHEVVTGTVVEELGPQWGPESMTGVEDQFGDTPIRTISTEYLVEVDDRLRGEPAGEIRVGIEGGTIDDCTIEFHGPELTPDEEVVLFLAERNVPEEHAAQDTDERPVYRLASTLLGIWTFSDDGAVTPKQLLEEADPDRSNDAALIEEFTHDWRELRERIITSLSSGEPPEGEFRPIEPVSLEDAPLQAELE
jgi:hypothetical protein